MDQAAERDLVELLAALRREGRGQSGLDPRLVPPDRESAYRVAGKVADALGWDVVGWKIAANKPHMQAALRTDRPIYGRVYAGKLLESPATVPHASQCSPIPEAEYVVRLGEDLPPRAAPYSRVDVLAAIASVHPGIELAECRFVHDDRFPPLPAILADGAGGGAVVIGPAIDDWRARDIAGQRVTLAANGAVRREGTAAEAIDDPATPLLWLANELASKGIGLKAGQIVSTGTLTGMLRPKPGESFVADFGPLGRAEATYAA